MADNVAITAGSGTSIATDDIAGVHVQRTKATWGPDGTANDTDVASGKPMPVQLRSATGLVPVGEPTDAKNTATDTTSVSIVSILKQISASIQAAATALTAGANTSFAKAEDQASADTDWGALAMFRRTATPANTSGADLDYEALQGNNGALWTSPLGFFASPTTDITRPADTNAYTANDALSDSTTAPTSGGFTLTGAARKSGGSGIITDVLIASSNNPGTLLQGEIHIFDQAVTNINDNAAYAISDAEAKTVVAIVPFTLVANGNNSTKHVQNLSIGFTCVGSANLRFLVKVINAYTPASGEVLTVRVKCLQID